MKLVTFTHNGSPRIGKLVGDKVLVLAAVMPQLPRDMRSLLTQGEQALNMVRKAEPVASALLPLDVVKSG